VLIFPCMFPPFDFSMPLPGALSPFSLFFPSFSFVIFPIP
jgi:hypothetical protein